MHKVILGNFFVWKGRTNAFIALSNDKLDELYNHTPLRASIDSQQHNALTLAERYFDRFNFNEAFCKIYMKSYI